MMSAVTETKKGQIVIPAKIRSRYGLVPGTQVEFIDDGESFERLNIAGIDDHYRGFTGMLLQSSRQYRSTLLSTGSDYIST